MVEENPGFIWPPPLTHRVLILSIKFRKRIFARMGDRALTANEVPVMENVLSCQKVILGIEERERGLDNRVNMRLGGGLHNTWRLR